jgi:hypothetical protein
LRAHASDGPLPSEAIQAAESALLSQIRQVRAGLSAGVAAGARAAGQVAGRLPGRVDDAPNGNVSSVDVSAGDDGTGGGDHGAF